jgi:site-specific DNA-adenine methylase
LTGTDLSKIKFAQNDYKDYAWQEGDVVYCDPPYNCDDHTRYRCGKFNTEQFWEWVRTRDYPVYVSEYNAPYDFTSIWNKRRGGVQNPNGFAKNTTQIEHLYINNSKLNSERK